MHAAISRTITFTATGATFTGQTRDQVDRTLRDQPEHAMQVRITVYPTALEQDGEPARSALYDSGAIVIPARPAGIDPLSEAGVPRKLALRAAMVACDVAERAVLSVR